jgi:acyl dehydratase
MTTVQLTRPPSTAKLFRRAALGALPVLGPRRGGTLPETTLVLRSVEVDVKHLAAYDRVCGFRLTDALPPTYPHILAFPLAMQLMCGDDFPFPVVGLVHVANHIEVRRPIDAGERLDLHVHAQDLRPHDRGRQLDVVASATVGDEEVWRGVSTYLRMERPATKRDRPADGESARRSRSSERSEAATPRGTQPAPPAPSATWRVAPRVGTDYAAVSGDHNPIHTSRLGARVLGFPRPIAHGMWSKARCLAALEGRLPDAYAVEVAFKLPVLLPATVAFAATTTGAGWEFSLHSAKSGKPHLTGAVTA